MAYVWIKSYDVLDWDGTNVSVTVHFAAVGNDTGGGTPDEAVATFSYVPGTSFGSAYNAMVDSIIAAAAARGYVVAQTDIFPAFVGIRRIAEVNLGADAADMTFTGIPATYRSLTLQLMVRSTTVATTENLYMRFNGDTAGNYDRQYFYGNNATMVAASAAAQVSIYLGLISGASAPANAASPLDIAIPDYARTTFEKTMMCRSFEKFGTVAGQFAAWISMGAWRSTAAITDIRVFPGANNFLAGSVATLWGSF